MFAGKALLVGTALAAGSVFVAGTANAALLGPTPYLGSADSPFSGGAFSYFHLETFEDGLLDTPGATAISGVPVDPSSITDSVDADDGSIDGLGTAGTSFFAGLGSAGISFVFDEAVLGALPTHAGIVWTDGFGTIEFEAFDENGVSLGSLSGSHADANFIGGTAEDRFYGATNAGGISRIHISNLSGGIEVDHLQYGLAEASPSVPEPGTLALLGIGFAGLALARRRRTG